MKVETGRQYEGTVSRLAKYGAFVKLADNVTGLVHISEVAETYVKNISEYLAVGDTVTVEVLKTAEDGKIALSIRKAKAADVKSQHEETQKPRRAKESPAAFVSGLHSFLRETDLRLASLQKKIEAKQQGNMSRRN